MASVIIAAHNEAAVIGACLDAVSAQTHPGSRGQVIVVANACSDDTAELARRHGATVIDLVQAGKAAALNAGEVVANGFPRIYLDADIIVPPDGIERLSAALAAPNGPLAVVPSRRLETAGRPWPVRAYFAINAQLPAFNSGLFGRGMIALSEQGRARFSAFPEMVADDLFLDSLFASDEKATVGVVEVVVQAPFSSGELLGRLVRVRRGNAQMRAAAKGGAVAATVRTSDRRAWLRVVVANPRLLPAAVPYVIFTLLAERRSRRAGGGWGRDESTRIAVAPTGEDGK